MEEIRERLGSVVYREHALLEMSKRRIDARRVIESLGSADAEIIEDYPDHHYGPCCLVLGWTVDRRPLHIVLSMSRPMRIITVWDPSLDPRQRWNADFRTRRQPGGDHQ